MQSSKLKKKKNQEGAILIICLVCLGLLVFLAGYLLSFALTGSKMAQAQGAGLKTYYLAEAGVAEAIFKFNNDPTWKNAFETLPTPFDPSCSSWSIAPLVRDPALFFDGSYAVAITNLGCAQAEIQVEAKIALSSGAFSQRIVKVKVFKAMGSSLGDYGVFLGGASENLQINFTNPFNVYDGSLFSNKAIRVQNLSYVNVENKALAGQNITVSGFSQLIATSCASNICEAGCDAGNECPPEAVSMPFIDFDSGEVGSFIYQAGLHDCSSIRSDGKTNCLFTPAEFETVMWNNYPLLSLPSNVVVYITGDFNLRAGQNLIVNGVLVADRDINLGEDLCWTSSKPPFVRCGSSRLQVIRPGVPADNFPAGILSKRKFSTGTWLDIGGEGFNVNGLVYAGDEMRFSSMAASVVIRGAIAGRKITFSSMWGGVDIYLDSDVTADTFKDAVYSPIITIEHWEEEY
ncbi:hypothetical protein L6252_03195 [Candidatus Parcubacteria bacterium]|nr:hypothetical protein [Candidatus Parcubacteria bacterium]